MLRFDVSERTISRWMKRTPRDSEPDKRWLTFLRNHREAIAAMDFFTVPTIGFIRRSDSAGYTIVTIEPPSPDRLSAGPYIYERSTRTRGSCPPESSCCIEAVIVFRLTLPKSAPFWVPAEVLATHSSIEWRASWPARRVPTTSCRTRSCVLLKAGCKRLQPLTTES